MWGQRCIYFEITLEQLLFSAKPSRPWRYNKPPHMHQCVAYETNCKSEEGDITSPPTALSLQLIVNIWKQIQFQNSFPGLQLCHCTADELFTSKWHISWAVKHCRVGRIRKLIVLESCTATFQLVQCKNPVEGVTLTRVHSWEKQPLILQSVLRKCSYIKKERTAIRRSAGGAILLRGLTSQSSVFFFILAQLYKQIQNRTSEGSRQQVLVLLLRRTPDSSVSLQAIPARTPLQWGGNWTDHTLFTHYAAKMKWAVPKHTVTGRGGRRSLFHQWHIF